MAGLGHECHGDSPASTVGDFNDSDPLNGPLERPREQRAVVTVMSRE